MTQEVSIFLVRSKGAFTIFAYFRQSYVQTLIRSQMLPEKQRSGARNAFRSDTKRRVSWPPHAALFCSSRIIFPSNYQMTSELIASQIDRSKTFSNPSGRFRCFHRVWCSRSRSKCQFMCQHIICCASSNSKLRLLCRKLYQTRMSPEQLLPAVHDCKVSFIGVSDFRKMCFFTKYEYDSLKKQV